MNKYSKYVGLDVHKDTIAVAIAKADSQEAIFYGEIVNISGALSELTEKDIALQKKNIKISALTLCSLGVKTNFLFLAVS